MVALYANEALGKLTNALAPGATVIYLQSGQGALFPTISGGNFFYAVLYNASTYEIVRVTANASDTLTVVRAQQGTTAGTFNIGDSIEQRITAADLNAFLQSGFTVANPLPVAVATAENDAVPASQVQAGGLIFGVDTGATNAMNVVTSPAFTSWVNGMALRIGTTVNNTGPTTLVANGLTALPVYDLAQNPLSGGEVIGGGIAEVVYLSTLNAGAGGLVLITNSQGKLPPSILNPPGRIDAFAGITPPAGWLVANGAVVSRTTYARLFAQIGATYGVGDGSTTFNLPDYRGMFLRGWDNGRGLDPGRTFASYQADMYATHQHANYLSQTAHTHGGSDSGHTHTVPGQILQGNGYGSFESNINSGSNGEVTNGNTTGTGYASISITASYANIGLTNVNAGGAETAPKNMAVLICISY
jgi:phage-related tail fiber protein